MRSAEIGNKQLIRAFGSALDIIDVKQFPGALSTEPIQMVVPLSLIPYKLVNGETSKALGGETSAIIPVISMDPNDLIDPVSAIANYNELRLVGGLSVSIVFVAPPTSSDRFGIEWQMFDWQKNGSVSIWQNNPETSGFPMDGDQSVYNFAMHNSGSNGGDRRPGASMMPLLGWIPAEMKLSLRVSYWDGTTSAPKSFPACSILVRVNAVESPKGVIPPV